MLDATNVELAIRGVRVFCCGDTEGFCEGDDEAIEDTEGLCEGDEEGNVLGYIVGDRDGVIDGASV